MKREGSLAERDFPTLLLSLYEERWSGQLTLTSAGVGKTITVQDGKMVFASSSSTDDRLGEQLLRRGRVSLQQLVDASNAVAPGKRLGTVLVEQGALTPKTSWPAWSTRRATSSTASSSGRRATTAFKRPPAGPSS